MKRLFPILSVITAVFLAYALYQALVVAPADAQQGEVYRIIYYHVPSAWTAFLLFFINFIASIQYLVSAQAFGALGHEVDRHRDRSRWASSRPIFRRSKRQIPAGMEPSAVATTVLAIPAFYFLIGWLFPGQRLDVLAVTSGGSWRGVLHDRAGHGPDLGAPGVGDLVGAGRHPADLDAGAVADLRQLSGAAALLQ